MKKISSHIKAIAICLTFLITISVMGKPIHLLFSDCDHNIVLTTTTDDSNFSIDLDIESNDCEFCKFTPQTPTLVDSPQVFQGKIQVIEQVKLIAASQTSDQSYLDFYSLRGPPSIC